VPLNITWSGGAVLTSSSKVLTSKARLPERHSAEITGVKTCVVQKQYVELWVA
jgi:hypothetical protein